MGNTGYDAPTKFKAPGSTTMLTPAPNVPMLSLQALMEQIEAGIVEAHRTLNRIEGPVQDQGIGPEPVASASRSGHAAMEGLATLNARLSELADRVGII